MDYHEYDGVRIPVMTGKSSRAFYNLPDDEIDQLRRGTKFTDDGDCREPGGFRGTPLERSGIPRLDDKECRERVEFQKRERAGVFHLFRDNRVPVKNQNGHGYCWAYGVVSALEAAMLSAGRAYVELSPHSIASWVKKGRDQGGWGSEALKPAQEMGVVPDELWPKHSRDYRLWDKRPELREAAAKYKPLEWINVPKGDMQATRSLLASNFACGLGLMWWGHLIMFGAIDWSERHGWLYLQRNSHGPNFGLDGWCFHTESSAKHGGGSAVRVAA